MKKRIILMLTTLCMIIAIAMPAGATNVLEESKELAMQSIVSEMIAQYPLEDRIADVKSKSLDEDVPEEIREAVTFSFSSSDEYSSTNTNSLTKQGTSDIDYSVKNLGEVTVNGKSIGNLYSATGTKKTKSGSDTMLGVEAYLSIVWIDNLGMDNVLVEVSGGWNKMGQTTKDHTLRYSATNFDNVGDSAFKTGVDNPFEYDNIYFHGLVISATSHVTIWEGGLPSSQEHFNFSLSPTIFD